MTIEKKLEERVRGQFDHSLAKEIRVSVYPDIKEFAIELDGRLGSKSKGWRRLLRTLKNYEEGVTNITPRSKGKIIKVYLDWLKEQKYNPYNRYSR